MSTAIEPSISKHQYTIPTIDTGHTPNNNIVITLYDYEATTDEELNFKKGTEFIVLNDQHEDWWFVKSKNNENEKQGYIPSTFVRWIDETIEEDGNIRAINEEEEEEYEHEDDEYSQDYSPHQDDLLPDDLLGVIKEQKLAQLRRKSSIKQPKGVKLLAPESDIILDKLPKGFRLSTLYNNLQQGIGKLSQTVTPELNSGGLAFRDLYVDSKGEDIRRRRVKCAIAFSVLEARNIPIPGDYKVIKRRARMAIFDKTNVLSNIHNLDVVYNPEFPNTWKFSSKASLLFPKDDENTCFLRVNDVDIRICVLFELILVLGKNQFQDLDIENEQSNELEISCGWGLMPLFTVDGGPIENKTFDIKMYQGTPFEKLQEGVTILKKGFWNTNRELDGKVSIRVWKLSKRVMNSLDRLGDCIIHLLSCVELLVMHRRRFLKIVKDGLKCKMDVILTILPQLLESHEESKILVKMFQEARKEGKQTKEILYEKLKFVILNSFLRISEFSPFDSQELKYSFFEQQRK